VVDWIAFGMITPIKDQKYCGFCWAFSALAALESALYNQLVNLSE
jgi:C1A family cysteine protease